MPTITYSVSLAAGGVNVNKGVQRTGDHPNPYEVLLPAGKAVTAWVKTDANTAACNLPGSHGYSNGNFDVHWSEAGVPKVRYGVPGLISTNALALDGGSGDDFPASATSGVVVTKPVTINTAIDGDAIQVIGILAEYVSPTSTARAHIDFQSDSPATVAELDMTANVPQMFDVAGGSDNPFSGDPIVVCYASNGSATETATLKIVSLEDSTP